MIQKGSRRDVLFVNSKKSSMNNNRQIIKLQFRRKRQRIDIKNFKDKTSGMNRKMSVKNRTNG